MVLRGAFVPGMPYPLDDPDGLRLRVVVRLREIQIADPRPLCPSPSRDRKQKKSFFKARFEEARETKEEASPRLRLLFLRI